MNRSDINKMLKPRDIKGKPYIEVNQRILGFWELFPDGRIVTEKIADDGKRCDFKCEVYSGNRLLATAHAYEVASSNLVNKTSYVENCETSAVGRALGMLGIGITYSLASADEVESAIEAQEMMSKEPAKNQGKPQWKIDAEWWIKTYAELHGLTPKEVYERTVSQEGYEETPEWWADKTEEFKQECQL